MSCLATLLAQWVSPLSFSHHCPQQGLGGSCHLPGFPLPEGWPPACLSPKHTSPLPPAAPQYPALDTPMKPLSCTPRLPVSVRERGSSSRLPGAWQQKGEWPPVMGFKGGEWPYWPLVRLFWCAPPTPALLGDSKFTDAPRPSLLPLPPFRDRFLRSLVFSH